ncbi:MAG TPA: CoA transferase [Thermomicrobiaceae bacterium]|nr:CoA transferase [Thermomicrobiaceae bacterium]
MEAALAGITVIDFSRHLAGPFAAMTLGDLGADVLKIEAPGRGDDTRGYLPFWNGVSCYYLSANRNKRSLTLNLQSTEGQAIARKLAAEADILIENFRPGTMERWGLGEAELRGRNPRLIYCAISAVGSEGPDRDRAGVDLLMQAYAGLMSITGYPEQPPVRVGTSAVDLTAGANAVQGILAALYVRERTGRGQRVESSLLEGQVSWLTYHAVSYFGTGQVPGRLGSGHASLAPYGAYPTSDGFLVLALASDALWRRFCAAVGRPELAEDARFARNEARMTNRPELEAEVGAILAERSAAEWGALFDAEGIPASTVNSLDTVLNLPQVLHREMVVPLPRDDIPDLKLPGVAIKLSETPGTLRRPPPKLGEHSDDVLARLGYQPEEIARLHREGVV